MNKERGRILACLFIEGVSKKDYGGMLKKLADDDALGAAKYPETVEAALKVLALYNEQALKRKQGNGKKAEQDQNPSSELQMAQLNGPKCWKCGQSGHLKRDCLVIAPEQQHTQIPSWMI